LNGSDFEKAFEFVDRDAITSNDERLAAVKRAHDLAALVRELSLTDLSRQITRSVARVLQES